MPKKRPKEDHHSNQEPRRSNLLSENDRGARNDQNRARSICPHQLSRKRGGPCRSAPGHEITVEKLLNPESDHADAKEEPPWRYESIHACNLICCDRAH